MIYDYRFLRRHFFFLAGGVVCAAVLVLVACRGHDVPRQQGGSCCFVSDGMPADKEETAMEDEVNWKEKLTPEQYRITRLKGTEAPFTGRYYDHKADGTYTCVCCGEPLFASAAKFDSGTGWPSFSAPAHAKALAEETDTRHQMVRTEVLCSNCDAHLGHVFSDGPQPTGRRYCINSAALEFVPARE